MGRIRSGSPGTHPRTPRRGGIRTAGILSLVVIARTNSHYTKWRCRQFLNIDGRRSDGRLTMAMKFKQFYLGCLSHASYYVGSGDEAAVIDPQRDVDQYIAEAAAHGHRIKYVIETHSHADFVSGHLELAKRTGAEIVYGERAPTQFPTLKVKNGDELSVG